MNVGLSSAPGTRGEKDRCARDATVHASLAQRARWCSSVLPMRVHDHIEDFALRRRGEGGGEAGHRLLVDGRLARLPRSPGMPGGEAMPVTGGGSGQSRRLVEAGIALERCGDLCHDLICCGDRTRWSWIVTARAYMRPSLWKVPRLRA